MGGSLHKIPISRTSLVGRCVRIRLPMQGMQVRSLGDLRPHMPQGNQVHVLQLLSRATAREKPAHHNERSRVLQLRPNTDKNK